MKPKPINRRYPRRYPRRTWHYVGLLGLLGLLLFSSIEGSLAQNQTANSRIFLPMVGNSTGQVDLPISQEEPAVEHDHDDHDHIGHIPEAGRFTANDGQGAAWPPQTKFIEDVIWHTTSNTVRSAHIEAEDAAANVADADANVQALLGERFTFINSVAVTSKWESAISHFEVTYFSYSNNITIQVNVEGSSVTSVHPSKASDYQPPLRQNEVAEAIRIARAYWQAQGNSRVDELQGFTIQTFPTDDSSAYYATRMSYVSFHVDETTVPELLTWVDLTNQTVVRGAIDQGGE